MYALQWYNYKVQTEAKEYKSSDEIVSTSIDTVLSQDQLVEIQKDARRCETCLENIKEQILKHPWIQRNPRRVQTCQTILESYTLNLIELKDKNTRSCDFTEESYNRIIVESIEFIQPTITQPASNNVKRYIVNESITLGFLLALQWIGCVEKWIKQNIKEEVFQQSFHRLYNSLSHQEAFDKLIQSIKTCEMYLKKHNPLLR